MAWSGNGVTAAAAWRGGVIAWCRREDRQWLRALSTAALALINVRRRVVMSQVSLSISSLSDHQWGSEIEKGRRRRKIASRVPQQQQQRTHTPRCTARLHASRLTTTTLQRARCFAFLPRALYHLCPRHALPPPPPPSSLPSFTISPYTAGMNLLFCRATTTYYYSHLLWTVGWFALL